MDENEVLDEFGRALVEHVRDPVVASWLRPLSQWGEAPEARRLQAALVSGDPDRVLQSIVPDIVDAVVDRLL